MMERTVRHASARNAQDHDETPARSWAADMGPGLVSAASDNDPSGIVTYSLAGAQFGYEMLWACVLSYPSMVAFQLVATRVAVSTGKGLTANMREHYSPALFYLAVARFLIANTFNIAADVVAMGVAAQFLWHGSVIVFAAVFGLVSMTLQWCVPYARYAQVLKWLTASLFAYVGVTLVRYLPWREVAFQAFIPHIDWSADYFTMLLAVLGTTISPYLLYSQAEQQVELLRTDHDKRHEDRAAALERRLTRARRETLIRTALSNSVGIFILCAAAATLHSMRAGLHDVDHAARIIEPLTHAFAGPVLGLAFIGTALLALPPLAGSAAHAAASALERGRGEERDRVIARALLVVMAVGVALGVVLSLLRFEPGRLLYWAAVLNGSTATPVMVLLVLLSTKRSAVGDLSAHWILRALCWIAVLGMSAAFCARFACEWLS
ncbi:NRAMP (natural resistance-associated macrophage protein)-like metal ion transporter [Paraburkholderia sp. GAS41]|jgi:NRAMP (natural resistance-associated macrophage protein)-like metal ion transporter|uniref:NRAMP family divalent metal transporter n=1 Tax=Paraburkholderia sp. GAS41 TaxID=3035134 RepID=UPI003D1C8140